MLENVDIMIWKTASAAPVRFYEEPFVRVDELDEPVRAAGEAVVAAVVEAHRQHRPLVNRHFCNTGIGNVHL